MYKSLNEKLRINWKLWGKHGDGVQVKAGNDEGSEDSDSDSEEKKGCCHNNNIIVM